MKIKEVFGKIADKLKSMKTKFVAMDIKKKILCIAALCLILLLIVFLVVWGVKSGQSTGR